MRVVIAPDKFAGTLSATEAASAIAQGWRSVEPGDDLILAPMSDGGTGFLDTVASVFAGLHETTVDDPLGRSVSASWLITSVAGTTVAVIEAAQACGLHRLLPEERDPLHASSYGVGQLILTALNSGARRILVGLGGTATNDGGAGMAQALGVRLLDASGAELSRGAEPLERLHTVDLSALDKRLRDVDVVAVADVDNPILGPTGASLTFAAQKGADEAAAARLDGILRRYVEAVVAATGADELADQPSTGAAGGLAFSLMAFASATVVDGVSLVADIVGLPAKVAAADVVVTGEGRFDWQSLRGKVPAGVAAIAGERGVPCIVIAGDVTLGRQEMRAAGVEAAYSVMDLAGSPGEAFAQPAYWVEKVASAAAREWSRSVAELAPGPSADPPEPV
jgi:glycerate kinase